MRRHSPAATDLRPRLEAARLDLLALFRALDADYAEALWGLDQPPGKLNLPAMLRDTLAALEQLPGASSRLRSNLPPRSDATLSRLEAAIRTKLNPAEAYNMVPGRDPQNC